MKINLSFILSLVAIVLVLVMGVGLVTKLLPNVYLFEPKIEVEKYVRAESEIDDDYCYDAVISISKVEGASKYEIYVNEEYRGSTKKNTFSLKDILGTDGGMVDVYVRAVRETSDGKNIVSGYSNVLTINISAG